MEKINPRLKQAEEHAFFFKCDPDVHGGGVGKREGKKEKKTPARRAYEFAECSLINCD